jgi:hypothetical protein
MRRIVLLAVASLVVTFSVAAQDLPKAEVYFGYNYAHVSTDSTSVTDSTTANVNGWTIAPAFYPVRSSFMKYFGIAIEGGGDYSTSFNDNGTSVSASSTSYHALVGPRIRFGTRRFTPYAGVLFGVVLRNAVTNSTDFTDATSATLVPAGTTLSKTQANFAYHIAGGIDVKLIRHVALRGEVGYFHTNLTYPNALTGNVGNPLSPAQNTFTISTGLVFR